MEQKDILLKEYQCDNRHFCDFINGILFEGQAVLKPNEVEELPTELVFIKELGKESTKEKERPEIRTVHRFRDLTKKCLIDGEKVIIAIQNQSKVDFGMPVRILTEDSLDYTMQCKAKGCKALRKKDTLSPVLSVVFYHGPGSWNGAEELLEMIKVPEKIRHLEKYLREHQEEYQDLPEDTRRLLFALIGKLDYYEKLKKKECVISMCKAFDDHYKSAKRAGRRLGRRAGKKEGLRLGMAHGIYSMIRVGKKHGNAEEEILSDIQECFAIGKEEAMGYMESYANYHFTVA